VAVRDIVMNGGMEIWLYTLLSSARDEVECSVSRPDLFTSRLMAPGTNWIRGLVSLIAALENLESGEISCSS
jgi:hypothetical protein